MIRLYEASDTSWTTAGTRLMPSACKVHEAAGGTYECNLTLPIVEGGAHLALSAGKILRVPVPPVHIPAINLGTVTWWEVNTQVNLYQRLPSSRRITYGSWTPGISYSAGANVTYDEHNYTCTASHGGIFTPPPYSGLWSRIADYAPVPGTVVATLTVGTLLVKLSDFNSTYMYVRTAGGQVGYVEIAKCTATGTTEDDVIPARDITEQSFRIDKVTLDMANRTATVHAVHVSYDLAGIPLLECNLVECPPVMALAFMKSQLSDDWSGTIATNINTEGAAVTADWSWRSPTEALLSPDTGFAPQLKARVLRDDFDIIMIADSQDSPALHLKYGVNLTGLKWTEDLTKYVTRVIPRGQKEDGTALMLADPGYIETSTPHTINVAEVLDVGCKVGDTVEKTDGTSKTLTEQDCLDQMEEEAQKRFDEDHCDRAVLSFECQFVLLGDTAEHPELAGVQKLKMYDTVRCTHPILGVEASAQVSDYTWDCLLSRYDSIKLGDVFGFGGRSVVGWDVETKAVRYDKVHDSAVKQLRKGLATEKALASTNRVATIAQQTANKAASDITDTNTDIQTILRKLKDNYNIIITL